jgi:hypothetical protein
MAWRVFSSALEAPFLLALLRQKLVEPSEFESGQQVQRAVGLGGADIRRAAVLLAIGIRGQPVSHTLLDHLGRIDEAQQARDPVELTKTALGIQTRQNRPFSWTLQAEPASAACANVRAIWAASCLEFGSAFAMRTMCQRTRYEQNKIAQPS